MSDLIERQAAIDGFYEMASNMDYLCTVSDYVSFLESLPSVHPDELTELISATYTEGFDDGYGRGKQDAQLWIPCSERLPKTNGRYIVTRGLKACNAIWNRVYIINYSDLMGLKAEKIWWDGNVGKSDFQKIDDVIAWKPLEEPYKKEQE